MTERLPITADKLNDIMEFDCVIEVHDDGTVSHRPDIYAPSLADGDTIDLLHPFECRHCCRAIEYTDTDGWVDPAAGGDDIVWRETCDENDTFTAEHQPRHGWDLLDGWSGQDGYSGPLMHQSEYIGGGMARHILNTPGIYVALVNYDMNDLDAEPTEWAVARKVEP